MASQSMNETATLIAASQAMIETETDNPVLNLILQIVTNIQCSISQMSTNIDKRLDALNNTVMLVSGRVTQLETETDELSKKFSQCEAGCQGISDLFDKADGQIKLNTTNLKKHDADIRKVGQQAAYITQKEITALKERIVILERRSPNNVNSAIDNSAIQRLHESVEDLQCRSMKNNLIFTNLLEQLNEDTESKLKAFLFDQLGIEHDIHFGNVHRFGRRQNGKIRPIVARFIYHRDLDLVLSEARWLKNTSWGIHEQFPKAVEDRRKKLYPAFKEAKRQRRQVKLVRDKLFIDGAQYMPKDEATRIVQPNFNATEPKTVQQANLNVTEPKTIQPVNNDTGYRDKLLQSPKDNERRYKRMKIGSDSSQSGSGSPLPSDRRPNDHIISPSNPNIAY